jgi:hypothetical protein
LVEHEEEEAQENLSHTRSLTMIFLRALRVSFVLFVTQKAFESKVNGIGADQVFCSNQEGKNWVWYGFA